MARALSEAQRETFARDGFLTIEGFADPADCRALIDRARGIVDAFDPDAVRSVFSTKRQQHTTDDWFLSSGGEIRCFFEEEAFDDTGALRQDKHLSINKIGHALHDRDPVFDRFSRDRRLAGICADVGMADPRLIQSMYIFKQPRIGGEVVCHQDSTFLWTEPKSCVGLWFALEDATVENGCMWGLPGRHREGLRKRMVRDGQGGVRMETLDPAPFPTEGEVPLEAAAGTLILLHGEAPHRSGANRSDRSRHAYAVHVIDGACAYPADNWLQRPADLPVRGF
jgi:phytanoyl-CoA hydroxylase